MRIVIHNNLPFKSIKQQLDWDDLGDFIVLLGGNGIGKTHLLEALSDKDPSTATVFTRRGQARHVLMIADWNAPPAPSGSLQTEQQNSERFISAVRSILIPHFGGGDGFTERQELLINDVAQSFSDVVDRTAIIDQEILERLPESFFSYSDQLFNERVAAEITAWHIEKAQRAVDGHAVLDPTTDPVSIFNDICQRFNLDFRVEPYGPLKAVYKPLLKNGAGDMIQWNQLSAGEKVLFRLVCWLFTYRVTGDKVFPDLLLLDEPDAHLTPKMTRNLIETLQETLVRDIGMDVVMTTHSPNTVALTDEANLYELRRGNNFDLQIEKITKTNALDLLSEGLILVRGDTRFVFVEDSDDINFYTQAYEWAVQDGRVPANPSLKFISSRKGTVNGGVHEVKAAVAKFEGTSIENIIWGICDKDLGGKPPRNILLLDRYCKENYEFDLLALYLGLLSTNKHIVFDAGSNFRSGDEQKWLSSKDIQRALDTLANAIDAAARSMPTFLRRGNSDPVPYQVYIKGRKSPKTLRIPGWLKDTSGKDIRGHLLLGGIFKNKLKEEDIKREYIRSRLLFKDVVDLFRKVQQ